jgi:predicted dehydrogenase
VKESGHRTRVTWIENVDDLPAEVDVAIVATSSDVRKDVVLELLRIKKINYMILEKFLFQDIGSFYKVEGAIEKAQVPTYVNCPFRIWPVYQAVAKELQNEKINSIQIDIIGDDIGCNGIHSIDLVSFFLNSTDFEINSFELQESIEAKRAGYLQLAGIIQGNFTNKMGETPFEIDASKGVYSAGTSIFNVAGKGDLICTWRGSEIELSGSYNRSFEKVIWDVPYQSALTSLCVQSLIDTGELSLPTYQASKDLHIPMLTSFLLVLNENNALSDPDVCPIT